MAKSTNAKKLDQIQKVTLSITETKEMIKHQLRQVIMLGPKFQGLMYFIVAEAGSGKTQIQGQILEEMMKEVKEEMSAEKVFKKSDYEYFMDVQKGKGHLEVLNLAAKDAQDFSGLPMVDTKTKLQSFAHPDSLPTQGYGTIFYDEANRVFDLDMKATLLSLWMDRGVNGHYLGDGYIQIAAGNPFDDPRFETEKFDVALSERFRIIEMVPTVAEVIAFLEKKYNKHFLLNFFKENKDFCVLASEGDLENAYSPRLIDKSMEITYSFKDKPEQNLTLVETILRTYFGVSTTARISKFLANQKEISFEKIVDDPELAKKIKKTDMPLMTKMSNEIFAKMEQNFAASKAFTKAEKTAMSLISDQLNAESLAIIMTKISAHENHMDLLDFMMKNHNDFMRNCHKVTDVF